VACSNNGTIAGTGARRGQFVNARPGRTSRGYQAAASCRRQSRSALARSPFFTAGSFEGLQSRQPALRCFGRLRL
jgi:hypothetical protein